METTILKTVSLELKEFAGSNIPQYVILSHTWREDELLFDEMRKGTATTTKTYAKVTSCCHKQGDGRFE